MTVASIETKVRRLLQDEEEPYHWSSDKIRSDLAVSIRALHKVRPETRYPNGALVDFVELPQEATDAIQIDDRFEDCLVYHTSYLAYSDDCTDPVSKALADDFLAKFNTLSQL